LLVCDGYWTIEKRLSFLDHTFRPYREVAKARNWPGTPHHGRTSCNYIFIEGTCVELQKRMVVKIYFGGSRQLYFTVSICSKTVLYFNEL